LAPQDDKPLSRAQAARYLGVGDRTLRRLIADGELGDPLRREGLDAYLAKVRVQPGSLAHLCMWGPGTPEGAVDGIPPAPEIGKPLTHVKR
jgi:hypothetical protein